MAKQRPDILQYPTGFTVLRTFQAVFSLIIVIIVAFTVQVAIFAGNCLMMFTACASFFTTMVMMTAHITSTHLYNYLSSIVLDVLLLIFWAASVAVLAAQSAILWAKGADYCDTHVCTGPLAGVRNFYGYVFAAICGLGIVEFVFFAISLIFHAFVTCRHRYQLVEKNVESEPVQINADKHQLKTEYRPYGYG